jgi:hypothetical protein
LSLYSFIIRLGFGNKGTRSWYSKASLCRLMAIYWGAPSRVSCALQVVQKKKKKKNDGITTRRHSLSAHTAVYGQTWGLLLQQLKKNDVILCGVRATAHVIFSALESREQSPDLYPFFYFFPFIYASKSWVAIHPQEIFSHITYYFRI